MQGKISKFNLPEKITPSVYSGEKFFIAPSANVLGDIRLGKQVSIWYQSVLRADLNYIEIGEGSNIQDGCILHVGNDDPCVIQDWVTVGHRACLHGCTVEEKTLIGIGATVLNRAVIGYGSIIAAGAVVKENEKVPPLTLMAGVPARPIRTLPETTLEDHYRSAQKYIQLSQHYRRLSSPSRIG